MKRRLIALLMILSLSWTMVACGTSSNSTQSSTATQNPSVSAPNQVTEGRFPVQQATYDDGDGTYTLMLLNTPPGQPPTYRTANLQMARLTEEQMAKGEKTTLEVKGNDAVMYLTEDFKIEYVHNVTDSQTNPQTGQPKSDRSHVVL